MDDDFYIYPAGSSQHYEAYKKEFLASQHLGFGAADSPRESYEIDFADELARERAYAAMEDGSYWEGEEDAELEEDDWDSPRPSSDADADYEAEP
jgi:hypothetical protein